MGHECACVCAPLQKGLPHLAPVPGPCLQPWFLVLVPSLGPQSLSPALVPGPCPQLQSPVLVCRALRQSVPQLPSSAPLQVQE